MRISPLVRMSRSGSGMPAVSSAPFSAPTLMSSGFSVPASNLLGERARRLGDLGAGAVVEGDDERDRLIVARQLHRLVDQRHQLGLDVGALADDADLDAGLVQLGEVAADEALHQPHQIVDLVDRARPVLGREAVEREVGDAELDRRAHRAPHRLDAVAMTDGARQAVLAGPAPVAVHDDGDVARRGRRPARARAGMFLGVRHRGGAFGCKERDTEDSGNAAVLKGFRPCGSRPLWWPGSRRSP